MQPDTLLSRREAALRSGATVSLAGIALFQALGLPVLFLQGGQAAVLSMAAMVLCIGLGWALAAAPAGVARPLWRVVAAAGVLVLAGWAVPHAVAIPGLEGARGQWAATAGAACAVLAAVCLVMAVVAAPPTRASARGLATAAVVLAALAPGAGAMLVGLGPGTAGGETVLASGGHIHSQGSPESAMEFQPIAGGEGGHFVFRTVAPPQRSAFGLALILSAAFVFALGAVITLRRRTAPAGAVALARGVERGFA